MAEEQESGRAPAPPSADTVAWGALGAASREKADRYLERQSALAELQMENLRLANDQLRAQDAFELSHLRFRRFSDYGKFAFELSLGLIVLLVVCALGSMIWSATQDRDLVVDAFSVPPDMAVQGLTGSVLASRVLDRFADLQSAARSTIQGEGSWRRDSVDVVRVEIPETGISLDQLDRYLRAWLGHETHVSGDLVRSDKGLALTVRYGDRPGVREQGAAAQLDAMIDKSAEHLFAAAAPFRFASYLAMEGRFAEAQDFLSKLSFGGDKHQKALADTEWSVLFFNQANFRAARDKAREAVSHDPVAVAYAWLANADFALGHDEESARASLAVARILRGRPDAFGGDPIENCMWSIVWPKNAEVLSGDYASASAGLTSLTACGTEAYSDSHAEALAADHDIASARAVADRIPWDFPGKPAYPERPWAEFAVAFAAGDWRAALGLGKLALHDMETSGPSYWAGDWKWIGPRLAYVMARNGDIAGGEKLVSRTPLDCDICLRMRGRIAGVKRDWAGAAHWFAIIAARSPDIPFADTDWGAMLLAKGDYDGAIAKFESAHAKGPHFADPLEMWGEALVRENRSDLALAKFEEADKYAPNWGRLHLKWGEALLWTGKPDEGKKQFAIAASLDLTPAEKSELVRMTATHG